MGKIGSLIRSDRKPLWEMIPLKQPLRINIDPCDLCNFRCDFCFQSKADGFKGNIMSDELFERILKQLKDFDDPINVIQLFCLGEPLINKNLPGYVRRIREEKAAKEVKITSNGSLLTHELTDELMEAGLDEFVFSLNGLDDDDYQRVTNTKTSFLKILDNIQYLYSKRGDCHVHAKIIGDYFSEEKQKYFIETIGPYTDTINIDGATNHWSGLTDNLRHQQYAEGDGTIKEYPICALCFYELAVHSDGTVSPCAADWQKDKQNLGNVIDSTLKEIWDSDLRKNMMISFLEGSENPYVVCRECEYPGSGVSVDLEPYREELLSRYV
jgi:radical SAM protein with 4Fe4S-binding SPASM domain